MVDVFCCQNRYSPIALVPRLMPAAGLRAQAQQIVTIDQLTLLKSNWGVSVAALAHRVSQVGTSVRVAAPEASRSGYLAGAWQDPNERCSIRDLSVAANGFCRLEKGARHETRNHRRRVGTS